MTNGTIDLIKVEDRQFKESSKDISTLLIGHLDSEIQLNEQ